MWSHVHQRCQLFEGGLAILGFVQHQAHPFAPRLGAGRFVDQRLAPVLPQRNEFRCGRRDRRVELRGVDDDAQFGQLRRAEMHARRLQFTVATGMCGGLDREVHVVGPHALLHQE